MNTDEFGEFAKRAYSKAQLIFPGSDQSEYRVKFFEQLLAQQSARIVARDAAKVAMEEAAKMEDRRLHGDLWSTDG